MYELKTKPCRWEHPDRGYANFLWPHACACALGVAVFKQKKYAADNTQCVDRCPGAQGVS